MAKIRKIGTAKVKKLPGKIKKISGGKEPVRVIEEFLVRRGFSPDDCLQQRNSETATWSVPLSDDEELEITLEGLNRISESTIYMGVNVMSVPIKNIQETLISALLIADTLIAAKLSLVNYDLVLSVTQYISDIGVEEIDYFFEILSRQKDIIREAIIEGQD